MLNKNYFVIIFFSIIFISVYSTKTRAQCPGIGDLLNHGYAAIPPNHYPNQGGNFDEFGVTDPSPFMVKVNDYPPVKTFRITQTCGTAYYFSFDTDGQNFPINHNVPMHQPNTVKTYRIDQNGNYTNGHSVIVTPPSNSDVDYGGPDFLMKYNGTMHAVEWDINLFPWSNYVSSPVVYSPQTLSVNILGPDQINYGSNAEYTADINGGSGYYRIVYSLRFLPDPAWYTDQDRQPTNYYTIPFPGGENYYFYDNEHKYTLEIDENIVDLKVTIYDLKIGNSVSAIKTVSPAPEPITFINHIQTSENFGKLILNENKLDPISSGDHRDLYIGTNYSIRTDELPFEVNWNSTGKTEKQNHWEFTSPTLYALNKNFTFLLSTERTMKSRFLSTDQAVIKTLIEGFECGTIEFKDPWYYYKDGNNNWYQSDQFKTYSSPLNLFNNTTDSYGGVFLNQSGPPLWNQPYFSVKAPITYYMPQTGRTHNLLFWNWDYDPNKIGLQYSTSSQTGVVFKQNNAVLTANLKGNLLASDQNGISSGSQRKLVRTDNGIYHLVYESLGLIWYTHSLTSNFNGSWSVDDFIEYGKNPSIDYEGNNVKIVFELYEPMYHGPDAIIYLVTVQPGGPGYLFSEWTEIQHYSPSYYGNAKPVIAYNDIVIFIAYRKDNTNGIYQKSQIFSSGNWQWKNEELIPNTSSYSRNPSVAGSGRYVDLVYEHSLSIRYLMPNFYSTSWRYDYYAVLSTGSGYSNSFSPSISRAGLVYPVVSWLGTNISNDTSGVEKVTGENGTGSESKVVVRRGPYTWSSFLKAGTNATSTNNNSVNGSSTEATIIAWSEGNSPNNNSKWIRRTNGNYTNEHPISHHGKQNQISNGTGTDAIEGIVFSTATTPYNFSLSTTNFSQAFPDDGEQKMGKLNNSIELSFGREGVINKNGIEFLFNIGDIIVGDSIVKFIEQPDTIVYASAEELNQVVKSEPFYLSSGTEFFFTNFYYVLNNEFADTALTGNDLVNFKAELVNEQTGGIVGTFDNITYTKLQLEKYDNISYQVNCSNIIPGYHYLRLVTYVEGEAEYFLGNIQNSIEELEKKIYRDINFDGLLNPASYDLTQNYPNPFNPTTIINYQIPEDGMVTLKIYDILGKEVKTLLKEQKSMGRYEVNFDAGNLASGVYIYRLQVNPSTGSGQVFVSSKKMMLLK